MGEWIESPTGVPARDPSYATAQVIEIPKFYQSIGSPWSLIQDQFETTSEYAESSYNSANGFIDDVLAMIKELENFTVPTFNIVSPGVPGIDYANRPNMGDLPLDDNWPKNTTQKPELVPMPTITAPDMPIYNISDPDIVIPEKPEARIIDDPGDAPTLDNIVLPQKPILKMPQEPVLQDITIPSAPEISIPEFNAEIYEEIFDTPAGMQFEESLYNSEIWENLLPKLVDGIQRGGVALTPEVEATIWERALIRIQVEEQQSLEEIENYFGTKGWDMPQGALTGAIQEKLAEIARNKRTTIIDIGVKQAEMAHQDTQFILTMAKDAEVFLRDFHNNQMNRKLESEKALAQNAIDVLQAHISVANYRIEKYKAEAMVFGERIKAILSEVEVFKAQVEGARVTADVQKNLVEVYEKQIQVLEVITQIYKVEMEGAEIATQIEARKIDIFKNKIDAYVAEIGGEKVKYEAYGIEADVERTKAQIFTEQIKGFQSQVDLVKTELEVEVQVLNAAKITNDTELDRYKSELSAFAIELEVAAKKVDAIVSAFSADVSAYNAETQAEASRYQAVAQEMKLRIDEARFRLELASKQIDSQTNGYIALKKLQIDGLTGVTNVSAQLAASAMNAVSASTSFGYSGSESMGTHFSYGSSNNESHSFAHPTPQISE